jgi:hypothetical protein
VRTRRWWYTAAFALLALFASFLWSRSLETATLTVSNCSGDASLAGTLGFQIAAATSGDTIVYGQNCTTTVNATILVGKNVTIDGSLHTVVLDGGGARTIIATRPDATNQPITLVLNGITFQNGATTTSGGAIDNQMGATVTITNSTFLNNSASLFGGAIFNGGGHLNVTNSTFSGNQVTGASGSPTFIAGGAIFNNNAGFADIKSSTFSANIANPTPAPSSIASLGGAIATSHDGARTFTLTDTLVAGNTAGNCHGADLVSLQNGFTSGGHNLIGVNSTLSGAGCSGPDFAGITNGSNNDLVGTDASPVNPLLGTLGAYGSANGTQTFPLLPGSPAIDAGGATCAFAANDQRGIARPVNGACDIGAFESRGFTMAKGTGDNQATSINTAFAAPLTATVASAFSEPVQGGMVTFTSPVSPSAGIAGSPVLASIGAGGAVSQTVTANATPGGPYTVNVTASGVATGTSFSLTNVGPTTHFVVTAPASATAGAAFNFTVTAQDASNNTATGYAGTVHFTSTDGQAAMPADTTLSSGTGTFSATLKTAGSQTITATELGNASITGISNSIAVSAAAATHFAVSAPTGATAGVAFNFTVTAQDASNNTATGYAGTVHFTSSDGAAVLPADSTLTNGVGTFSATLKTAGGQAITATDTGNASISGKSGPIAVSAGAATHFAVSAPANATAGTAFSFTVTAQDAANNTATGFTGTVHFTSTDAQVSSGSGLPPDYPFVAGDSGVHTFTNGATLKTAGPQKITATQVGSPSVTGDSNTITVSPDLVTHFLVTAPASATANTPFNFTVTAQDLFNNTATSFAGTVHFTSTDPVAVLPADSTLTNGVGTFSATLKTFGPRTITATDTANPSTTGTSGSISVGTGAAASLVVVGPVTTKAGQPYTVTVTAKDGSNNTKTDYTGTVKITISDPVGRVAPPHTYVLADNGVASFTVLLNTDGTTTVTATDTAVPSVTGSTSTTVSGPAIFSTTASDYGVTPINGPTTGGTTITIVGNGFVGATSVTAGGVACTAIVVNPAGTQITCATGPHAAATVDVVVTTPLGTATATAGFTYVDPGKAPPPANRPGPSAPGVPSPAPPTGGGPTVPGSPGPAPAPRP